MSISTRMSLKNCLGCLLYSRNMLPPTVHTTYYRRFKATEAIPSPKYTTSKAAKWKASESFTGEDSDTPWYQPHSVIFSVSVFLIYFCILREENDLDALLYKPLSETVPGMEKANLRAAIENLKIQGKDYSIYETRLKELERN